jgi:hypothetical protein
MGVLWHPLLFMRKFNVTINNIPSYFIVSRKKRYTSMNLFYSNTHWSVRKGGVDKAKKALSLFIDRKLFNKKTKNKLLIKYTYSSNKTTFDIENRLGFWSKVFLDYAKGSSLIKDDNVKHISSIVYESYYHKEKEDILQIEIYDIPSKGDIGDTIGEDSV